MKAIKKKYYLTAIVVCLIGMILLTYSYLMGSFSSSDTTQYVYIDDDDNIDSVCAKLEPFGHIMAFQTLSRHFDYPEHIKTGRYASNQMKAPSPYSVISITVTRNPLC